MDFMDFRIYPFMRCWKNAIESAQTIHKFRTHSKEEAQCFKRMLAKRAHSDSRLKNS
jgi:hypothetical protein